MEKSNKINDWIPLLTKLVWPIIILIALIVFSTQVSEVYKVVMKSIKEGRAVEFGGFLKLGEAASTIEIGKLSQDNISIDKIGGGGGVVRKGSEAQLTSLQKELEKNPTKTINTMLINNNIYYSVKLLKDYVSTLGLKYVVFQKNGVFDGWIMSGAFVAQLPANNQTLDYYELKDQTIGIRDQSVNPTDNARDVLWKMQDLHMESLPVVDEGGKWLFFANRGEILSTLMTTLMLENEEE